MNFLHYGLQRSGTNFLHQLMLKNFADVKFLNNEERALPTHKHFRLYDDKEFVPEEKYHNDLHFASFEEFDEAAQYHTGVDDLKYLVIVKNPFSWYLSITKMAESLSWPSFKADAEFQEHFVRDFNGFYEKWSQFAEESDKVVLMRYEDLLEDTNHVLSLIQNQFELKRKKDLRHLFFGKKNEFFGVKRVPNSKHWGDERKDYYVNQKYYDQLGESVTEKIKATLNPALMSTLEYEL